MNTLYDQHTICDLIPQREPMIMVDAFYGIADETAYAGLIIRQENIFVEDNVLREEGLMEHMAQSAAARAGYVARSKGEPVRLGYIGAVTKAEFCRLPRVGEQLLSAVRIIEEVMDITLLEVETRIGDERVAACRMKIFTEK